MSIFVPNALLANVSTAIGLVQPTIRGKLSGELPLSQTFQGKDSREDTKQGTPTGDTRFLWMVMVNGTGFHATLKQMINCCIHQNKVVFLTC